MELGFGPGDFVLDGDPVALSPKGGRTPKFSAHVYCDQTAGWMKLVLGIVVGLSPQPRRVCVRLGPSPSFPKGDGASSPILRVEVRILKLHWKCGALLVVANF